MKSLFTQITTDKEANISGGAFLWNVGVQQINYNNSPALSLALGGGSGWYGGGASAYAYTNTYQGNSITIH